MPGNYRYEEERNRGQRGSTQRGEYGGGRGRDDDEMEQYQGERYGGYGREWGGGGEGYQRGSEGSWGRGQGGRESGRSLGMRGDEGYEEDSFGSLTGGREGSRYGDGGGSYGQGQGSRGQGRWGSQRGQQGYGGGRQGNYGQGGQGDFGSQGGGRQQYSGQGFGTSQGYSGQSFGGGMGYGSGVGYGQEGGQRYSGGNRGGSMQGDGWNGEPDEMQWGRQQGLYGSSEYGGHISSQRSQGSYQSHAGKGPKGWKRSDERIREEISEALSRHPEIDASEIEVRVQNGEITLTGTVTDRRAKRLAEDVAEGVFGANDVQNQIKVQQMKGDRDVTGTAEREGRTGQKGESTEGREAETRKATR